MFGNILNNSQISACCERNDIIIDPFDEEKLKLAHYPLSAGSVSWATEKTSKGTWKHEIRSDFRNGEEYVFEPNEYAIIEVAEFISLSKGIAGHFVPSSNLIELGFGLTAGKIDPGYGKIGGKAQQIVFGLKNLRQDKNTLLPLQNIAHIYFIDLRGLNNMDVSFSKAQVRYLMDRNPTYVRARDDGPAYGTGE